MFLDKFAAQHIARPRTPGMTIRAVITLDLSQMPTGVRQRVRLGLETGVCTSVAGDTYTFMMALADTFGVRDVLLLSTSSRYMELQTPSEELVKALVGANRLAKPRLPPADYRTIHEAGTTNYRRMRQIQPCWLRPLQVRRLFSEVLGTPDHAARREAVRAMERGGVLQAQVSY